MLLGKELQVLSPFQIVGLQAGGSVYDDIMSQPFLIISVWVFLVLLMCSSCLGSFGVFSEEIVPYVAVDSVSLWEEGSSRYFYAAILNLPPNMTFSQFLS